MLLPRKGSVASGTAFAEAAQELNQNAASERQLLFRTLLDIEDATTVISTQSERLTTLAADYEARIILDKLRAQLPKNTAPLDYQIEGFTGNEGLEMLLSSAHVSNGVATLPPRSTQVVRICRQADTPDEFQIEGSSYRILKGSSWPSIFSYNPGEFWGVSIDTERTSSVSFILRFETPSMPTVLTLLAGALFGKISIVGISGGQEFVLVDKGNISRGFWYLAPPSRISALRITLSQTSSGSSALATHTYVIHKVAAFSVRFEPQARLVTRLLELGKAHDLPRAFSLHAGLEIPPNADIKVSYLPGKSGVVCPVSEDIDLDTYLFTHCKLSAENEVLDVPGTEFGEELITNGDMSVDSHWANYTNPPINERNFTKFHSAPYSRKFTSDSSPDGIQSDTFTTNDPLTQRNERHRLTAWVWSDQIKVGVKVRCGDNSAWICEESISITVNEWNKIEVEFYDTTVGGAGAYIVFCDPEFDTGTWYIDDVSLMRLITRDLGPADPAVADYYRIHGHGAYVDDENGNSNSAMSFTGDVDKDDRIRSKHTINLYGDFCIMMTFRPALIANHWIIGTNAQNNIKIHDATTLALKIDTVLITITLDSPLILNEWVKLVINRDEYDTIRVWINGTLQSDYGVTGGKLQYQNIGANPPDHFFKGDFSEIRAYTHSKSERLIKEYCKCRYIETCTDTALSEEDVESGDWKELAPNSGKLYTLNEVINIPNVTPILAKPPLGEKRWWPIAQHPKAIGVNATFWGLKLAWYNELRSIWNYGINIKAETTFDIDTTTSATSLLIVNIANLSRVEGLGENDSVTLPIGRYAVEIGAPLMDGSFRFNPFNVLNITSPNAAYTIYAHAHSLDRTHLYVRNSLHPDMGSCILDRKGALHVLNPLHAIECGVKMKMYGVADSALKSTVAEIGIAAFLENYELLRYLGETGVPQSLNLLTTTSEDDGNKTGIPLSAHGYKPGWFIEIKGEETYVGVWEVDPSSTLDSVIINKAYEDITFGVDDTVERVSFSINDGVYLRFELMSTDPYITPIIKNFGIIGLLHDS